MIRWNAGILNQGFKVPRAQYGGFYTYCTSLHLPHQHQQPSLYGTRIISISGFVNYGSCTLGAKHSYPEFLHCFLRPSLLSRLNCQQLATCPRTPYVTLALSASKIESNYMLQVDFAHRMFDAARKGDGELLYQAIDAGLPPNLTNSSGQPLSIKASSLPSSL